MVGALVVAVSLGGARPVAVPVTVVVVLLAIGVVVAPRPGGGTGLRTMSRWVPLMVAILVTSSWRSHEGAVDRAPVAAGVVDSVVVLRSDPIWNRGAVEVTVAAGDIELLASGRGAVASCLVELLAGERAVLTGAVEGRGPQDVWLARLGVHGQLAVDRCTPVDAGSWPNRWANHVRRSIEGGATFGRERTALYVGLVYGDDRNQSVGMADDFRRTGLGHLLAVSGQNVAFVLAVAAPLLRRLPRMGRVGAALALLGLFATMTRFEPSVLRAVTVAGGAVVAEALGRPSESLRLLGLAVVALVLIDPTLTGALGFQLSVAASAGIIVLSRPIERLVPGPRPVAEALAVTASAQLAVAPLLLVTFGELPVVSLPANLLAGPAAGFVMMWGSTAGILAGVAGGWVAQLINLPTGLALWWLETVARTGARVPLGTLGGRHLVTLVVLGVGLVGLSRHAPDRSMVARLLRAGMVARLLRAGMVARLLRAGMVARLLRAGIVAVLLLPGVSGLGDEPAAGVVAVDGGARLWRGAGGGVVLEIDGRTAADRVLAALRERSVERLDLVVVTSPSRNAGRAVRDLGSRLEIRGVWVPERHHVRGGYSPESGEVLDVGGVRVTAVSAGERLEVEVGLPP